jgi:hypothetical protein
MQITKYLSILKKNKANYSLLFLIIFFFLSSVGCKVDATYSNIPEITMASYKIQKDSRGKDSLVILQFTFTDGNGDVGLFEKDTIPPNNVNIFVDYFEKEEDGVFRKQPIPLSKDSINFNSRIAFQNQPAPGPLKGEVELKIDISIGIRDTLLFKYFIKDRSLNTSNMINSGPIAVKRK